MGAKSFITSLFRKKPTKPTSTKNNRESVVDKKDNKLSLSDRIVKDCVEAYAEQIVAEGLSQLPLGDISNISIPTLDVHSKKTLPDIFKESAKINADIGYQRLEVEKQILNTLNSIAQLMAEKTEQGTYDAMAIATSFSNLTREQQIANELKIHELNDNLSNSMNYSKHLSDISSSLKSQSDYYSYKTNGTILDVNGNPMRPAEAEAKANIETAWSRAQENGFDFIKDFMDPDKESLEQQKLSMGFLESFNPQTLADKLRAKLGVK
jgi:hypothetical protein